MHRRTLTALLLTLGFSLACGSSSMEEEFNTISEEVEKVEVEEVEAEPEEEPTPCCCKKTEEGEETFLELLPDLCAEDGECVTLAEGRTCEELNELEAKEAPAPKPTRTAPAVAPKTKTKTNGKVGPGKFKAGRRGMN